MGVNDFEFVSLLPNSIGYNESRSSEKKYPESFRLIRYYDEEEEREFTFLTNAKHLNALEVAELYKKRWLVELFTYGQNSPLGPVR